MDIIRQLRGFIRNPILIRTASIASLVEQKLEHLMPKNAHELCSGRLGISLTKIWSFENKFVSEFESRQDLIDACKASCFIPGWSGSLTPPEYKGVPYIDGGFSDNRPMFPNEKEDGDGDKSDDDDLAKKNATRHILISGIAIEADVTPRDEGALFKARILGNVYLGTCKNVMRCMYAIIPTSLERYKDDLVGGYIDMKEYLFRNDLLKCRDCWHKAAPDNGTATIKKEACIACLKVLEQVDSLSLPTSLFDAFKE